MRPDDTGGQNEARRSNYMPAIQHHTTLDKREADIVSWWSQLEFFSV